MQVPEENGLVADESKVLQIALRAITALSILLASLLFFLVVPLFPRELMVFFAIGLGALAYKAPTPALTVMILLVLPGYVYQLSYLPIPMVVVMSALLLMVAIVASETGGAIGVAAGGVSAILMLTSLQFLALPILIGTTLFRTRGMKVRAAATILTFVILYYPVLAINSGAPPGGMVTIFEPVLFHTRSPVPILSLPEISTTLGQVAGSSVTQSAHFYLAKLADYWPLSFDQRLMPVGLLFCILAVAAIAATGGMLSLFRWLKERGASHAYLSYAAPAISLLIGTLTFFLLSSILAQPLNYSSTISIPALLIGTILVGSSGSLAEVWLRKRDRIWQMRDYLSEQVNTTHAQTDLLINRIRETKAQCYRMDTGEEEALVQICQQEIAFAEQTVDDMSLLDLEQKMVCFQELQTKLNEAFQEGNAKLYQYYDENRQKYNDFLILAEKYGFHLGEGLQGPDFSNLKSMKYEEVLKLQTSLNDCYQNSAGLFAEGVKKLEERLCSEVDPEFKRTGIHIACDYFSQERCSEAIQEFLSELGDIEKVLLSTITGLDKEVITMSDNLRTTVNDVLIPTAVNLGDEKNVSYYKGVTGEIDNLYDPPVENPALPDIMRTLSKVSEIGKIVASLSSKLSEKIIELERSTLDKTPRGYNWGIDPAVQNRISELALTFRKPTNPASIEERISRLKSAPSVVDSAAHAVKDYSIALEVLINYANIEGLIEEKLHDANVVSYDDLPVKRKYSRDYLELYCLNHPGEVCIEGDTGRLTRLCVTQAINNIASRK